MFQKIKIKFFPLKTIDYIFFFLLALIQFTFLYNVTYFSERILINNRVDPKTYLIVPKSIKNYQEKKDLLFTKLSVDKNIISIIKIHEEEVMSSAKMGLEEIEIPKNYIPDVFVLRFHHHEKVNILELNKTIKIYISEANLIKEDILQEDWVYFLGIFSVIIYSLALMLSWFTFNKNIFQINNYLLLSRLSGVSNFSIAFNILLGVFIFQTLAFIKVNFLINVTNVLYLDHDFLKQKKLFIFFLVGILQFIISFIMMKILVEKSLKKYL